MMVPKTDAYRETLTISNSLEDNNIAIGVQESTKVFIPTSRSIDEVNRLVVLVPENDLRPGWWRPLFERLNAARDIEIVLVALNTSDDEVRRQNRRLNKLLLPLQREYPCAQGRFINSVEWAHGLQLIAKDHDLLVCFSEQQVIDGFLNRQPLSQALLHGLNLPVIEILGAYPTTAMRLSALAKNIVFQAFPFIIVALFFWFQMQINQQQPQHDLVYKISLGATVVLELGLVFVWSLFLD